VGHTIRRGIEIGKGSGRVTPEKRFPGSGEGRGAEYTNRYSINFSKKKTRIKKNARSRITTGTREAAYVHTKRGTEGSLGGGKDDAIRIKA